MLLPEGGTPAGPLRSPKGDASVPTNDYDNFDLLSSVEALRPQGVASSGSASLPKGETPPEGASLPKGESQPPTFVYNTLVMNEECNFDVSTNVRNDTQV